LEERRKKGRCWGESRKHVKDETKPNPANMKKGKKEKNNMTEENILKRQQ